MRLRPFIGYLFAAALLASGACTARDDGEAPEAEQPQAISIGVGAGADTKADASVIREMLSSGSNPQFRGLSSIKVIPFFTGLGLKVRPGDRANGFARLFPDILGSASDPAVFDGNSFHNGLLAESHAHYFSGASSIFSSGTTAALVYSRATEPELPEEPMALRAHKQLYGSLVEKGWTGEENSYPTTADIGFSPDPIYGSDIATAAEAMATLLTQVASGSVSVHYYYNYHQTYEEDNVSVVWADSDLDCTALRNAFLFFVEDAGEGAMLFSGAGVNLLNRLSSLESILEAFSSDDSTPVLHTRDAQSYQAYISVGNPLTKGYLYNALCEELKTRVQECKTSLGAYSQFPGSFGLPAGAAFMKWNGASFQALPEALDGWVPATQYCYMPSLYYYVNTAVSTSFKRDIYEEYPGKTWKQIVALHKDGKMVTKGTRVVVLDDPLQFACGMLVATVQATVTPLSDRQDEHEFVLDDSSTDFPLTGIIIGGQYSQHYDFSPVTDDAGEIIQRELYMYDANVPGIYVNTQQSDAFRSLALPTPLEREVYFYLEMRNDSGRDFRGADGIVPQGSRFYLAGKIPAPSETDVQNGVDRVFMRDRYTQITCKVISLENAYLCIPQMGNPELVLGVETKVNWFFSPSSYVLLG